MSCFKEIAASSKLVPTALATGSKYAIKILVNKSNAQVLIYPQVIQLIDTMIFLILNTLLKKYSDIPKNKNYRQNRFRELVQW